MVWCQLGANFSKIEPSYKIDRLNCGESSVAVAKELGVHRRLLYEWRDQVELADTDSGPPEPARVGTLRKEVTQLKRVLVDKTLIDWWSRPTRFA